MTETPQTFLPDDAATAGLGRGLAALLPAGSLVLLQGDLGAGKTAQARSMIRALLRDDRLEVPSPSFALVQPYEGAGMVVRHADLYRLAAERDLDELGLFDRPEAIVIVEWPERAPALLAEADLIVELSIPPDGEGRLVRIRRR